MWDLKLHLPWLLAIAGLGSLLGCGSDASLRLEHLELLPEEDADTVEFALGEYDIPIPEHGAITDGTRPPRNYMQLEFSLFAEIATKDQPHLAQVFARHEGMVRDRVIQVFRNATLEDLDEPNLVTLKLRLVDAIEPVLGQHLVRRAIIPALQRYEL